MQPLPSLPASSISTSSPSSNLAELLQGDGILQLALNEFPVDIDDHFIMSCNNDPVTCSNFEEQLLVAAMPDSNICTNDCTHDHRIVDIDDDFSMPCNHGPVTCCNFEEQSQLVAAMPDSNMCANNCLHDHRFGRCGNALHVEIDNTNMDCSLDTLEKWPDAISISNMELSDMWEEFSQPRSQTQPPSNAASSSACNSNSSPACSSRMISLPSITDTNDLFIESLPVYSNTYQYDSHPLDYMNNHLIGHLDVNMGLNDEATNSTYVSYSPSIAGGNVPMRFSGSAESGDDCFGDVESIFAAMASAPALELNLLPPLPNSESTATNVQLNLEARSSPPLYKNLKAAHSMPETRAIKKSGNCEAKERVSILVKSSTPSIDDGFRWCKYGQKNIKDQMHPRCYFKCAQHNCPVKKQTESSSNMQGYVLITYFGKHNH